MAVADQCYVAGESMQSRRRLSPRHPQVHLGLPGYMSCPPHAAADMLSCMLQAPYTAGPAATLTLLQPESDSNTPAAHMRGSKLMRLVAVGMSHQQELHGDEDEQPSNPSEQPAQHSSDPFDPSEQQLPR